LRWRKNDYGGIIHINYTPTHANEVTFAGKTYTGTGTVAIDFLNHSGFTVDNVEPDAVVHLVFMRGSTNDAENVHILVPFVAVGDQGSFPITSGSDLIHSIVGNLKTYQPHENDPSTQLTDVNVREFIPDDADYYYAASHHGDKYIILRKIQGLKTDDKSTLFDDLFKIGSSPKWASRGGTNLDIVKYYASDQFIKISKKIYKGGTQEGFTGMNSVTRLKSCGSTREGFETTNSTDDIYIDCQPVGVDEETKPVTVKHEKKGGMGEREREMLINLLMMMAATAVLSLLIYLMYKAIVQL